MDIARDGREVSVFLNGNAVESGLEDRTDMAVLAIEAGGVKSLENMHGFR
jgi:hypothetical protein